MMTTLCIRTLQLLDSWLCPRGTARGIVSLRRRSGQIGEGFAFRSALTAMECAAIFADRGQKGRVAGGQGENGSTLSDREVHPAAGRHAGVAAASDFCNRGGARQASGGGKRTERRAVEYSVSRRWLDGAPGSASCSGQPHERVRAVSPGADGAGAHNQTVRRGALGGIGGCQVSAGGCFVGAAGFVARPLGALAAFAEDGGFCADVSASGSRSAHAGLAAVSVCVARTASHRARHGIAKAKRLVTSRSEFAKTTLQPSDVLGQRWRSPRRLVYDGIS